jgi:hypothetical protein
VRPRPRSRSPLPALGAIVLYGAYSVFLSSTPLDKIPGPDPSAKSWLWGWYRELQEDHDGALQAGWVAEHGHVFVHRALFGVRIPLSPLVSTRTDSLATRKQRTAVTTNLRAL